MNTIIDPKAYRASLKERIEAVKAKRAFVADQKEMTVREYEERLGVFDSEIAELEGEVKRCDDQLTVEWNSSDTTAGSVYNNHTHAISSGNHAHVLDLRPTEAERMTVAGC